MKADAGKRVVRWCSCPFPGCNDGFYASAGYAKRRLDRHLRGKHASQAALSTAPRANGQR